MIPGVILLYDADCGLCRWGVVWVLDRDRDGLIEPLAIQSPPGQDLLHDLEPAARLSSAHVITPDGRRASGGAALQQVLEALPNRVLARAARLSPRATDAGYRFVAAHRVRFSRLLPSSWKRDATAKLREFESREGFGASRRL
jgi:predicted DCC family thiol-disulfide oxidoreductase YuxK